MAELLHQGATQDKVISPRVARSGRASRSRSADRGRADARAGKSPATAVAPAAEAARQADPHFGCSSSSPSAHATSWACATLQPIATTWTGRNRTWLTVGSISTRLRFPCLAWYPSEGDLGLPYERRTSRRRRSGRCTSTCRWFWLSTSSTLHW